MGDKGSQGNAGAVGIRGPTGVSGKRVSTLSQNDVASLKISSEATSFGYYLSMYSNRYLYFRENLALLVHLVNRVHQDHV